MNTDVTLQHLSKNSENTEAIGEKIGKLLRGGEVIELMSDLGGGKTTFVRGLARGMGSTDTVASPTFMICKQYRADALTLYHYDFYRLSEPGIMEHELQEGLSDPHAVIVVEWADIVADILPKERITITIKNVSEHERQLSIKAPKAILDSIT
ncbi:MAG: tRNA (adenosine(37)-N6)-threonylcarbamoyltransferase complex ATPase subunit type 1 TsaE [Candidatus Saccharibacteria bacterium]|nr:tRNA (adenosine(37)-N6)-threonylcarbamoyltransferase complex ATPase subunit type 1 TsaE [Candidatus Saccharibacteria bacterium]